MIVALVFHKCKHNETDLKMKNGRKLIENKMLFCPFFLHHLFVFFLHQINMEFLFLFVCVSPISKCFSQVFFLEHLTKIGLFLALIYILILFFFLAAVDAAQICIPSLYHGSLCLHYIVFLFIYVLACIFFFLFTSLIL